MLFSAKMRLLGAFLLIFLLPLRHEPKNAIIMLPEEIARLREYIARCKWTFAKSMPWCPHEYIVRGKCDLTDAEFVDFVLLQRKYGTHLRWRKYNHQYLFIDEYKYWTMGDAIENTIIMNRQHKKHWNK